MKDDPNTMVYQLGQLNGTLTEFAKNQTKTNDLLSNLIQKHEAKDEVKHSEFEKDISSLKVSRKVQRAVLISGVVGTPAVAAKVGMFGKILAAFAGN
jgi:hypothetical protein